MAISKWKKRVPGRKTNNVNYNKKMRGVDLADNILYFYTSERWHQILY